MKVTMNDSRLTNISQLRAVLKGAEKLDLSLRSAPINEKYKFVDQTINRLNYSKLKKKDKKVRQKLLKKVYRLQTQSVKPTDQAGQTG